MVLRLKAMEMVQMTPRTRKYLTDARMACRGLSSPCEAVGGAEKSFREIPA
jgi:hypothetical protein